MAEATKLAHDFDSRLSRLETIVESLADTVKKIPGSIGDLREGFYQSLSNLANKFDERGKTDWRAIFSAAALVLLIIGMFSAGYVRDLNRVETTQIKWMDVYIAELKAGIAQKALDRAKENKEGIKHLDETLQREMRLLDQTAKEQVLGLDARIQKEMELNMKYLNARLSQQESWLKSVQTWKDKTIALDAEQSTMLRERIRSPRYERSTSRAE
ncbi:MAG: hypothetical protein V3S33_06025 [Gammaproteobacteria bacterium]